MEPALMTEEKVINKTYKHFTLPQAATAPSAGNRRLEFFYVGKRSENIDQLIRSFTSGYAAETPQNAAFILSRLISQNNTVPDVIIVEGGLGTEAIAEFYKLCMASAHISSTPFVLESSGLTAGELEIFKRCSFIDEIIAVGKYSREGLVAKINFLRKIKAQAEKSRNSLEVATPRPYSTALLLKRAFDITVSSLILLIASPVFLLIALAIRLESKGSIFYVSQRAGRGYRIFNFFKFRTMYVGADAQVGEYMHMNQYGETSIEAGKPVFFKINNDPRITRVGAFLRKTSLDELPQLLNVIKGDMSLVGNRPLPLYEAATLTTDDWARRFMAPAGITGLWQIKKRGQEEMSAEERILLDCDYAEKYNFMYDLWIMANTPSALIQKTNA